MIKNKQRILILSGAEDQKGDDPTVTDMFNLTIPSKQKYAQTHGYDLSIIRSFGIDKNNKLERPDNNHVGFLRVLRALELLPYYDIVMWVDGDSIITNNNLSINDFPLDDDHSFYVSWDWMHKEPYRNGNYVHRFSLGNFILKNTNKINEFSNMFYHYAKYFPEEQHELNTLYDSTILHENIKILDHNFLGGVPQQVETLPVWKTRGKIVEPWNKTHFLAHLTGISNQDRISILKQDFVEYL